MLADAVLTAVSEGRAESVPLAQELAEAVLGQEEVQRAAVVAPLLVVLPAAHGDSEQMAQCRVGLRNGKR